MASDDGDITFFLQLIRPNTKSKSGQFIFVSPKFTRHIGAFGMNYVISSFFAAKSFTKECVADQH